MQLTSEAQKEIEYFIDQPQKAYLSRFSQEEKVWLLFAIPLSLTTVTYQLSKSRMALFTQKTFLLLCVIFGINSHPNN